MKVVQKGGNIFQALEIEKIRAELVVVGQEFQDGIELGKPDAHLFVLFRFQVGLVAGGGNFRNLEIPFVRVLLDKPLAQQNIVNVLERGVVAPKVFFQLRHNPLVYMFTPMSHRLVQRIVKIDPLFHILNIMG